MDGLFEIIFILFFVLAAVFDAVARSRSKKRRMEEMDAEQAEARGGGTRGEAEVAWETEEFAWEQVPTDEEDSGSGPSERRTADQMIPDDFWAVLTGEAPSAPEAPREPHIPVPVPSDRMGAAPSSTDSPHAPPEPDPESTRRSSRWMEGVGGREESDRWDSGDTAHGEIHTEERRAYRLPPSPWGSLGDIALGEIDDQAGRVQERVSEEDESAAHSRQQQGAYAARRRSAGAAGRYTDLLTGAHEEDLRTAIVLREVLGPPVGFRERGRERDIW